MVEERDLTKGIGVTLDKGINANKLIFYKFILAVLLKQIEIGTRQIMFFLSLKRIQPGRSSG